MGYKKSTGKAWAKGRIQKRIRIINRMERSLRAFERRHKPKNLRRYDKKLNEVMNALFIVLGKFKQALTDCIPPEEVAPKPMPPLRYLPPPPPEQSDGLHRAVPTEKSTPEATVEQPVSQP